MSATPSSSIARTVYSTTNVGTSNWVVLVASTIANVTSISCFDSSGQTLKLGIAPVGADADSERDLLIIPPGGFYPLAAYVPVGYRISIKALSATASQGENDLNVSY